MIVAVRVAGEIVKEGGVKRQTAKAVSCDITMRRLFHAWADSLMEPMPRAVFRGCSVPFAPTGGAEIIAVTARRLRAV
ncbi:hypothetical protein DSLASN_30140 [Desulfoluna limicola]|uniref:Uncharacterized protein n=1 Tax=Desulfoluna limicola TaxID=2810562 RepID=A0ABM7PJP9_9BACT|nr:hypothetical protein DSLASN_30140 [Desulfoluna limicola]